MTKKIKTKGGEIDVIEQRIESAAEKRRKRNRSAGTLFLQSTNSTMDKRKS
jgi:hypothetical protein